MKKDFFTTGQIAKYCEVNYRTVCKWVQDGKMKGFPTPGGHYRVAKEDFYNFCQQYSIPIPEELASSLLIADKKRVLVVDDDKTMVRMLEKGLLSNNTYDFKTAFDGFSAGKIFTEFKPHLLLLDIQMPKMDGYQVCKMIKDDPENRDVVIIIMSAHLDTKEMSRLKSLGAKDFLPKPFTTQRALEMVTRYLKEEIS